jgi:hypothetical protein
LDQKASFGMLDMVFQTNHRLHVYCGERVWYDGVWCVWCDGCDRECVWRDVRDVNFSFLP